MKERIQKLLAHAGYGSRREIERWIEAGEVVINGQPATLGQQIGPEDRVVLRGQKLHLSARLKATPRTLMYHKQAGEVCTRSDPEGRATVFKALPHLNQGRWVMVGRLDVNTDGLLLFTTDGELANRLMHPSSEIEREYAVRVFGEVTPDMLARLESGVELEDGPAHFLAIRDAGGEGMNHWYHVVLAEGRNREARRLWESQGVQVSRLRRIRYGNITLPRNLRAGQHQELDYKSLRELYRLAGLEYEPQQQEKTDKTTTSRGKRMPSGKKASPYAQARARINSRPDSGLGRKPR